MSNRNKKMLFISISVILVAITIYMLTTNKNAATVIDEIQKPKATEVRTIGLDNSFKQSQQSSGIGLYTVRFSGKSNDERFFFISLSEIYPLSDHPDSLALPAEFLKKRTIEDIEYIKLDSIYRKRLLSGTGIDETDKVFLYDYTIDSPVTFAVADMNIIACPSPYADTDDALNQHDYMIGLEVDTSALKAFNKGDYYNTVFAYVGKENPFVVGDIQPIVWKKVDSKVFPQHTCTSFDTRFRQVKFSGGTTYKFMKDNMIYLVQNISHGEISGRHLLVLASDGSTILFDEIYAEDDGVSLQPLNEHGGLQKNGYQWTGKLLKNKSPVIFGFEYSTFGCAWISLLNRSDGHIYVLCDNRH